MKISVLICFALVLLLFLTIRGEKTSEEKTSEEKTSEEKTSEDKEEDNEKEHEEETKEHEEKPTVNQEKKKKEKKKKEKRTIPKRLNECGVNASLICESLNKCEQIATLLDKQIENCSDNAGCNLDPVGCQNDYQRCIQSQNTSEQLIKCHVNLTNISHEIENCLKKRNKTKWFEHVEYGLSYMASSMFDYSVNLYGLLTQSGVNYSDVGVTCQPQKRWSHLYRYFYQYFYGVSQQWRWPSQRLLKCGITGSNITAQIIGCGANATEINTNIHNCTKEREICVRNIPCPDNMMTCTVNTSNCDEKKRSCMEALNIPESLIKCGVNVTDILDKVKSCLWQYNVTKWLEDTQSGLQTLSAEMHASTLQHKSFASIFFHFLDIFFETSQSVTI